MEDRGSKKKGKRIRQDDDEEDDQTLASTQEETPAFVWVFLKAKEKAVCPYLTKSRITLEELRGNWQSLLPKIFGEELLSSLGSSDAGTSVGQSEGVPASTSRRPESGKQKLQLCVGTGMPAYIFAGDNIKGEGGLVISVSLIDPSNGSVVETGSASAANLEVVVLHGDFDEETTDGWEHEFFESYRVKNRKGKRPLLVGTLQVKLKGGVGILGDVSFTDNSSWIPCKSFRLGFALGSGFCGEIRVMEAKTNAFRVKDQRGKPYDKRGSPALHDEVWRLKNIWKDGKLDRSLATAEIRTVGDLLHLNAKDPQRLRTILMGMTEAMWETTIKHAMTCSPPADKNSDGTKSSGNVFDHIHGSLGFTTDTQVAPLQSLDRSQKFLQISRGTKAYENRDQVVECDSQFLSSIATAKEIKNCAAEQAYSINHNIIPSQTGQIFHSDQQIQPYTSAPQPSLEPPFSSSDPEKWSPPNEWTGLEDLNGERLWSLVGFEIEQNMVSDSEDIFEQLHEADVPPVYRTMKALVGWLKIKAVLKWGMLVSVAAKKRAKLTQTELG